MNRIKKIMLILIIFVVFLTVSKISSAKESDDKSKALEVYKKYLSKKDIQFKISKNKITKIKSGDCKFALIYLDNDNIPELLISVPFNKKSDYFNIYQLLSYNKKKNTVKIRRTIVTEGIKRGCDLDSLEGFYYYKKRNVYLYSDIFPGEGFTEYYSSKTGKMIGEISLGDIEDDTFYLVNSDNHIKVNRQEFMDYIKKKVGSMGQSRPKFVYNNKKNRKKM